MYSLSRLPKGELKRIRRYKIVVKVRHLDCAFHQLRELRVELNLNLTAPKTVKTIFLSMFSLIILV